VSIHTVKFAKTRVCYICRGKLRPGLTVVDPQSGEFACKDCVQAKTCIRCGRVGDVYAVVEKPWLEGKTGFKDRYCRECYAEFMLQVEPTKCEKCKYYIPPRAVRLGWCIKYQEPVREGDRCTDSEIRRMMMQGNRGRR